MYFMERFGRELKKSHIHLIKGKKAMQEKLLGLDEKCQNMMLLKFGREVKNLSYYYLKIIRLLIKMIDNCPLVPSTV